MTQDKTYKEQKRTFSITCMVVPIILSNKKPYKTLWSEYVFVSQGQMSRSPNTMPFRMFINVYSFKLISLKVLLILRQVFKC